MPGEKRALRMGTNTELVDGTRQKKGYRLSACFHAGFSLICKTCPKCAVHLGALYVKGLQVYLETDTHAQLA